MPISHLAQKSKRLSGIVPEIMRVHYVQSPFLLPAMSIVTVDVVAVIHIPINFFEQGCITQITRYYIGRTFGVCVLLQ